MILKEKISDITSEIYGHDGGADEDRTRDLLLAKQALSQLSYSPKALKLYRFSSEKSIYF